MKDFLFVLGIVSYYAVGALALAVATTAVMWWAEGMEVPFKEYFIEL